MTTSEERTFEDRLQVALQDLADEVRPALLLDRVQPPATRPGWSRRTVLGAAAVAALVVAIAAVSWLRADGPRLVEPVQRPPTVFRLPDRTSDSPGPAMMAITLTNSSLDGPPAYLVPAGGGRIVAIPPTRQAYAALSQRLSADGRVLVRQNEGSTGTPYVIVDLASGRVRLVEDHVFFLALTPKGRAAAEYTRDAVELVDLGTGARRTLRRLATPATPKVVCGCFPGAFGVVGGLGWSPDGSLLAMKDGADTLVVDRRGELRARLRGVRMVNGSQSWSPDSQSLLVYDGRGPTFSVRRLDGTSPTVLQAPAAALRPLGWAGSRVVWLTGAAGNQRLVLADKSAEHTETWMRFDVGAAAVESATWSTDLAGTMRR